MALVIDRKVGRSGHAGLVLGFYGEQALTRIFRGHAIDQPVVLLAQQQEILDVIRVLRGRPAAPTRPVLLNRVNMGTVSEISTAPS